MLGVILLTRHQRVARSMIPTPKVAVVWRGNREARRGATPQNNRVPCVSEGLAAVGVHAESAVYDEEFTDEVRDQLLAADGVLVWVDRCMQGRHGGRSMRYSAMLQRTARG
jgi:hypothetical protein